MKTMTELITWFITEYPSLYCDMKRSDHHYNGMDHLLNMKEGESTTLETTHPLDINPYHVEGDIFTHTMMVCKQAENMPYEVQIAALLHDIGKPDARSANPETKRVSFYNHDAISAFKALEIMNRPELSLNKEQKILIFNMIALHTQVFKLDQKKLASMCTNNPELAENLNLLSKADSNGRFYSIPSETKYIEQYDIKLFKKYDKTVTVLCGLPCSGKSRWSHNNIYNRSTGETSYILSRDHYFLEHFPDLSYNEAWKHANQKMVDRWLVQKFAYAKNQDKVIIDMTHMSKKSRRKSLSHFGPEYKKKCVVFLPDLETIRLRNSKRDGKVLDSRVFDRMIKSFYPPSLQEFDEIEYII